MGLNFLTVTFTNPVAPLILSEPVYTNETAPYQKLAFPVSNVDSSGKIAISVNGVSSLNNLI